MAASPGRRPEQFGGKAEVKDRVMREMMKPIIFGNHQKKFKVFTFAVCTVMTWYLVFRHDFGEDRHCFSWVREFSEDKKRQFFSIDPNDAELMKIRERHKQKQQQQQNRTEQVNDLNKI